MTDDDVLLTITGGGGEHPVALITRRMYLITQSVVRGTHYMLACEAVASTALAHPEWDMEEQKTWTEWEETIQ